MSARSANINVMIAAARRAGRSLMRDFGEISNLQASQKGPGEFMAKAYTRADQIIQEDLLTARPAYGWSGPEAGEQKGRDQTRRWIVDPLNGVVNYLHGIPHFAISIALEYKKEIVSGLIFNPATDEVFFAEKGQGAWLNDRRIRVSARPNMTDSLYATALPSSKQNFLSESFKDLAKITPVCSGVRTSGSATLDLASVCAGRYEGYWEREVSAWALAAGIVLIRESGGLISDMNGAQDMLTEKNVVAANGEQFEHISRLLGVTD